MTYFPFKTASLVQGQKDQTICRLNTSVVNYEKVCIVSLFSLESKYNGLIQTAHVTAGVPVSKTL